MGEQTSITVMAMPDHLWQAFMQRDRSHDGEWYVGVRTTGIYCRPSCAARRPKRENVVFLRTRDDADRAGFRPCLRCRPDEIDAQADVVARACQYIVKSTILGSGRIG